MVKKMMVKVGQVVAVSAKQNKRETHDLLRSLKGSAFSIFFYGVYSMEPGTQVIYVNKDECKKDLQIKSDKTFYKGVKDLCAKGVFVKKGKYMYEMNKDIYVCKYDFEALKGETGLVIGNYVIE